MMHNEFSLHVKVIGPLPPFGKIASHLWGADCDFDSDGDSSDPESTNWQELTLIKRPGYDQRLDIDPVNSELPILKIVASSEKILEDTVQFFQSLKAIEKIDI